MNKAYTSVDLVYAWWAGYRAGFLTGIAMMLSCGIVGLVLGALGHG